MRDSPYLRFTAFSLLISTLLGSAQADGWTIQTASFRDFRQATEVVEILESLGYDAYTEFAMSGEHQYTRVRVGCFQTLSGAEQMARHLRDAVTAEAVPQLLTEGAVVESCTSVTVGFFKPQSWSIFNLSSDRVVFEVVVAGRVAFVQHREGSWSVLQSAPTPSSERGDPEGPFVQEQVAGRPLVMLQRGDRVVATCPGHLLWQSAGVAVVDDGNAILSCQPGSVATP